MTRTTLASTAAGLGLGLCVLAPLPAEAVDWSAVPAHKIVLLYPAQTSFEWSLTPKDHSAAQKFKEGKNCKACHIDEEEKYGVPLAEGLRWEPNPIPGKRGAVPLEAKFAEDGERFYVRVEWKAPPGPSAAEKMDKDFPAKLSLILDDGAVPEFTRAGCWAVCHDDQTGMASAGDAERDKYLAASRTKIRRSGGGDDLRPQAQLDQMLSGGKYLEYWQARLKPGAPAVPVDGYILETRHENPKPAITADATFENGTWTVVMSRALTGAGPHHKDLVPGKTYTIGLSVHEDYAAHRFHQVSWEWSLALGGGEADIVVGKK
jgi:cytochrome c-type protein NapC